MALGGGTYVTQNKILPGAYRNFVSKARALGALGERGILAMMLKSDWGIEGEVFSVVAEDFQKNSLEIFGYSYTDDEMLYIREAFLGAKELLLFRPEGSTKASATLGSLTVTAKYGGERGNDITIAVEQNIDSETAFDVITYIGGDNIVVDKQIVENIKALEDNAYVVFSGTGALTETAGTKLTGGTTRSVVGNDYSIMLGKMEAENFTSILYDGTDSVTKALFTSYTKRLRDDEGFKITTVLHDYPQADYEGVISVKNTVAGDNEAALVYWVAGQNAGAQVNKSLTNKTYDGELDVNVKFKKSEFTKALLSGEFALYGEKGIVKVLEDINTFTSFEPYKNADFHHNQVIRVLDEIANGTARIFDSYYLGKVQNSPAGRDLFRAELINYHNQLQNLDAITNFKADDITVEKGIEKGDVLVDEVVEPVGVMTKIYMLTVVA